jgi:hypothetical protein
MFTTFIAYFTYMGNFQNQVKSFGFILVYNTMLQKIKKLYYK